MRPGFPGQRGSVLVLALLVIATLTGLSVAFSGSARTEVSLAALSLDALRAEALARAGVEAALQEIAADEDMEMDHWEEEWGLFNGTGLPLDLPDEASLSGGVADEAGKLNLNLLLAASGDIDEPWAHRVERLFDILGLDRVAYESLLDWLDSDDIQRLYGAEAFYYQGLKTPYACANGPLTSIGQVRLVRGFEALDAADEEVHRALAEAATVYTDGKVNVNTASVEVLQSLDAELDRGLAEAIADRRADKPFRSVAEVMDVRGMETAVFERIQGLLTVKTSVLGALFEGRWGEAACRIHVVAERTGDGLRRIYWKVE